MKSRSAGNVSLALALWIFTVMLAGCMPRPSLRPVSDPNRPVRGYGFSVLPPPGNGWYVLEATLPIGVVFHKADPAKFKLPDERSAADSAFFYVAVLDMDSRGMDVKSAQGLLASLHQTLWKTAKDDRIQVTGVNANVAEAYGTYCVNYQMTQEERDNPYHPGQVLDISVEGWVCKPPNAESFLVHAFASERKPHGQPSGVDDQLKREVADFFKYLMVIPVLSVGR